MENFAISVETISRRRHYKEEKDEKMFDFSVYFEPCDLAKHGIRVCIQDI